ncbi:MAG: hypothetical protein UE295_06715 [Acutalibacteraceae bacterium]|nr:hypothetical protein [Acutalibacteraceae bacterium]
MKKHLFKVVAVVMAIIAVTSVTGCGMKPATVPQENNVKISEFKAEATGAQAICQAMKKKEYVTSDNCVKTNAELIGAAEGYRMDNVKVNGSSFSVEIYEFKDTTTKLAKGIIDSVKKDGSFTLFGRKVKYAYMSDNNKYLLIYPDVKSVSDKEKDKPNVDRKNDVLKLVNSTK